NDAGQVVGDSMTEHVIQHAFITGPNGEGMTDLNSFAELPNGAIFVSAEGINNLGQVIATTVPEPASCALMLAGLGLVGIMARRRKLAENNARTR
ncbi:MAG: PEPxxWA-CTERM sorting domain-containing protein, partial [Nitrosospira sp.]